MSSLLPIVHESLEAADITHRVFECDPEMADTAAFCERYGFELEQSANTIMVATKTDPVQYAACVVLATDKLDVNKKVCQLLGVRKASFAPMEAALELSHMEYGGVTIFGLPEDLRILVDSRVLENAEVVMGGGNRSSKVILDPQQLLRLGNVEVIEDLAKRAAER
jgi:prolyl-tRNA editing enzyme YbaK/EbsC (Cys-tRNA(Pro) deacylase)